MAFGKYFLCIVLLFIIHIRSCALLLHKKKTPTWKERLVLLQITKLLKKMKCTSHVDCNSRTELDLSLSVVMITIISAFKLPNSIITCIWDVAKPLSAIPTAATISSHICSVLREWNRVNIAATWSAKQIKVSVLLQLCAGHLWH